jgi:hypothetical protein
VGKRKNAHLRKWIVDAFYAAGSTTLNTLQIMDLVSRAHPRQTPLMNQLSNVLVRHQEIERVGYVDAGCDGRRLRAVTWRLRSKHRGTAEASDDGGDDAGGSLLKH